MGLNETSKPVGALMVISPVKLNPETFNEELEEATPKQAVKGDNTPETAIFGEFPAAILTV